jgi:hypothetical protein
MLCFVYFGSDYIYMYVYVYVYICVYVCVVYFCLCWVFLIFFYRHCYNIPNLTNSSKNVNRYQTSFSYLYTSIIVVLCINHTHITCNKFSTPDIFRIIMFSNCSLIPLIFNFYIKYKMYFQPSTAPLFTCTDLKVNIATYLVSNKMTGTSYLEFLRNIGIT